MDKILESIPNKILIFLFINKVWQYLYFTTMLSDLVLRQYQFLSQLRRYEQKFLISGQAKLHLTSIFFTIYSKMVLVLFLGINYASKSDFIKTIHITLILPKSLIM